MLRFTKLYPSFFATALFAVSLSLALGSALPCAAAERYRIAIANYGPHSSLEDIIEGFRQEMKQLGYEEGRNIEYEILHANFNHTLIPQMLVKLKLGKPHLFLTLSTPVTQAAKHSLKDIPLVFAGLTDPAQAGVIPAPHKAGKNISGASCKQDLRKALQFAKTLLPHAKTVGLLYAPSETNDAALLKSLKEAASSQGMKVIALAIHQSLDIPTQMQAFSGKVDFIYVGTSGPIQPSLPAIAATANALNIPVFNADAAAVHQHQVLGAFAVSYRQIGANAARIAKRALEGEKLECIPPLYPDPKDYKAVLSRKNLERFGLRPANVNATIVE